MLVSPHGLAPYATVLVLPPPAIPTLDFGHLVSQFVVRYMYVWVFRE